MVNPRAAQPKNLTRKKRKWGKGGPMTFSKPKGKEGKKLSDGGCGLKSFHKKKSKGWGGNAHGGVPWVGL